MRALVALTVGVLVAGCSSAPFPMGTVKGRVVYNGEPVKDASVTFAPAAKDAEGKAARVGSGSTDSDGRFSLSTFNPGDGALVGKHTVSVAVDAPYPTGLVAKEEVVEVKAGTNEVTIELVKPDTR